jgi:hypothetical protein
MLEASSGPPGDGAEHMEIGEERLRRGGLRAETRRRGLIGEPEHKQRIAEHQLARGLRPGEVVLIEAANLPRRQAVRSDRRREADAVLRLGARQRHEVLHRGVRDDGAVADVLVNRRRQRAHQTEAARHPAHAPIEAPRDHVERESVLLVQGVQEPRLLKHIRGRVGLEQRAKDERLRGRHLPDDRGDRVAVQPMQAADTLMAVHDEVPGLARHHHDRHLLADLRQRRQQPALAGRLPHAERVVASIQLVKFQVHGAAISTAGGLVPVRASPSAPHATAHRRCSAATSPDDARPARQPRVCRSGQGEGNPDPSRGGAPDRPAVGRDDRAAPQDFVDDAGAPRADRRAGPRRDTLASSRRVRDRTRDTERRTGRTLGTCAPEAPTPRGRSAERVSSISGSDLRQNDGDWFGLPQRRVGHEGLERSLQVLTLTRPRTPYLSPADL